MFKGKTILERVNSSTYKLNSSLSYENDKVKITVKKGMLTDGASIPRLFWTIIGCPLSGKYVGSALIHDGLYGSHAMSQEDSDNIFFDMMCENGVGRIKRKIMYWAVKYAGKSAYNATSEEQSAKNAKFVTVTYK